MVSFISSQDQNHASPVRALSFLPSLLLVGSDDRTITIHDVKTILSPEQSSYLQPNAEGRIGATVASLTGHKGWVFDIAAPALSTDVFASVAADKSTKFWDLTSATKNTPVWNGGEAQMVRAFAFQPPTATGSQTGGAAVEAGQGMTSSMTRFVTASEDGKLRWYRGAGLG
uniref:Uncharacterized protein n=1 Tax=Kalmanozyma brasiliensis (strain GHG001) TaxID=1365824 RepID=V5EVB0_KALBG